MVYFKYCLTDLLRYQSIMKNFVFIFIAVILFSSCQRNNDNVELSPVENNNSNGKNIIFLIGDGMGLAQISAARTVNGNYLNILRCTDIGLVSTSAADKYVTDSGASGTAYACGEKTNFYTLGVDVDGNPLTDIFEIIEPLGYSTGLITTDRITGATPGAFYAHQTDRFKFELIALDILNKGIDFFAGGGKENFNMRADSLNLLDSLYSEGYQVVSSLSQIQGDKKVAALLYDGEPPKMSEGRGNMLSDALNIALNRLSENKTGFFIMAEGAQIDWACHDNDQEYLLNEMADFDKAVGVALDFAEQYGNTLVVILADHETGGYALVDGNVENNTVVGEFVINQHTGTMIPVFAYGPGAENFTGTFENNEVFYKFLDYFGIQK